MADSKNEEAGPVEVPAVTQMGATFAERAAARAKAVKVEDVEDKSVTTSTTKARKPRTVKKD